MRDGHAHDLAARLRERVDLREVRRDVGRRGVQHGLHDDGRAAAERHGAHRHPAGSLARFGMRCHKSLPFSIPHRVQARCWNSVSTARRLHAPKRVAGYFTSDYPVSGQMHRDFAGGRTTTNAREGAGGKTSERVARADAPSNHPNRTGGRVQRKLPESPKFASYAHLRHAGTTVSDAVERFRSRKRQVRSFL